MKDSETDPKEFFVTRRGKQVGVHQLDMEGIDIRTPGEPPEVRKKRFFARPSVRMPRFAWSRRARVSVGIIVLLVFLVPVTFFEIVTAQYASAARAARDELRTFVDKTVLPAQRKQAMSSGQLRSFATELNDIASKMCRGGLVDNASQLYPRARSAHDTCKTNQALYMGLVSSLYGLEADARYLEQLDALIRPVATPITDQYAVIGSQLSSWQEANEKLKKLTPSDRMRSAHGALAQHVSNVTDAWSRLNQANADQNADKFKEAEQNLNDNYALIRETSQQFVAVLSDTQASVTKRYEALR